MADNDEVARRQRRIERDINWGLIAGRAALEAALERDDLADNGLPSDDRELMKVLRLGVLFGVCASIIAIVAVVLVVIRGMR
jgi:hypothetical protein